MKKITLTDITLELRSHSAFPTMSFREKLELAHLLDGLGVDTIEYPDYPQSRSDVLLVKALASSVQNSCLSLPVSPKDPQSALLCMDALKEARNARLRFPVPVSAVQMEYILGMKGKKVLRLLEEGLRACCSCCEHVELVALDASRSDADFLDQVIETALQAGCETVTYCDDAGILLPQEMFERVKHLRERIPSGKKLAVRCGNSIFLAEACAMSAIQAGADEIKVCAWGKDTVVLEKFDAILKLRGTDLVFSAGLHSSELHSTIERVRRLCEAEHSKASPFEMGVRDVEGELSYSLADDEQVIRGALSMLGYSLSPEDEASVFSAFREMAGRKERISEKELDAIVASAAMQVPASYKLESYVINSCNLTAATAHIRLVRDGKVYDGLSLGDGPIDAVFLAIEQIVGTHYELDDFQIRAVTEGTEAMGETLVRLRSQGRVYGGRGISTDIVGSGVQAYLNALNKIVYEETEA